MGNSDKPGTSFARKEDKVYELKENLIPFLKTDVDYWIDKTLLSIDKKDINKIHLETKKSSFTLNKQSYIWTVITYDKKMNVNMDNKNLQALLDGFKNIRAKTLIYKDLNKFSKLFEDTDIYIELESDDGDFNLLSVKKDDKTTYLFFNGNYFEIDSNYLNVFDKKIEDFQ